MNIYLVICAAILLISVVIYAYATLIIHRADRELGIKLDAYKMQSELLTDKYNKCVDEIGILNKSIDDCLKLNDKILDHTDDIIKDNYRLSQEMDALSQEIRKGLDIQQKVYIDDGIDYDNLNLYLDLDEGSDE